MRMGGHIVKGRPIWSVMARILQEAEHIGSSYIWRVVAQAAHFPFMTASHWFTSLAEMLEPRSSAEEVAAAIFIGPGLDPVSAITIKGDVHRVPLPIHEIVRRAASARATLVLLAHTHPSGDPRPSRQDILLTGRLSARLQAHGMAMYDHIILAQARYFSFRSSGLLQASENCALALATQAPAPYRLPPALPGSYDSGPVGE